MSEGIPEISVWGTSLAFSSGFCWPLAQIRGGFAICSPSDRLKCPYCGKPNVLKRPHPLLTALCGLSLSALDNLEGNNAVAESKLSSVSFRKLSEQLF